MNTDTGEVFRDLESRMAAEARGEPIADVSEDVANAVEIGMAALKHARSYVQRVPETEADFAAVQAATDKRDRRAKRNLALQAEA